MNLGCVGWALNLKGSPEETEQKCSFVVGKQIAVGSLCVVVCVRAWKDDISNSYQSVLINTKEAGLHCFALVVITNYLITFYILCSRCVTEAFSSASFFFDMLICFVLIM